MSCMYVDRQQTIQIPETEKTRSYIQKVCQLFRGQPEIDTVKITSSTEKLFVHLGSEKTEIFHTRKELRKQLSQDSGGSWIEQGKEKQKYFLDKGWIFSQIQEVGKKEFLKAQNSPSISQKVTGIALGLLGLAPAAIEIGSRLSASKILSQEIVLGLLALQQKNPGIALLGSYAVAQTTTDPSEFQINTNPANDQQNPDCAGLTDGGFVVVWQRFVQAERVLGQLYGSDGGAVGGEFQVAPDINHDSTNPTVTALDNARYLVTWTVDDGGGDGVEVFGKTSDETGSASVFQVNMYGSATQPFSSLAHLQDGGFVVAWVSLDGSGDGVFGQRYNNLSQTIGQTFRINNHTANTQSNVHVDSLPNGCFIAVWESLIQDGDKLGIYGQRFTNLGEIDGDEFRVNNSTIGNQKNSRVVGLPGGGFVVVWQGVNQNETDEEIYGKQYATDGVPLGMEFQVNNPSSHDQRNPDVAVLENGNYVVTWESFQSGVDYDIYALQFDRLGIPYGEEFQVNLLTEGNQTNPRITALTDGGFLITWRRETDWSGRESGIFGKRFDQRGVPILPPSPESSWSSSQSFPNTSLYLTKSMSNEDVSPLPSSNSSSFSSSPSTTMDVPPSSSHLTSSVESSSSQTFPTQTERSASYTTTTATSIRFGTPHVIYVENNPIGTFTLTEGVDTTIITLEFSDDFALDDGETVTLFTFSQDNGAYENIVLDTEDGCYEINGENYSVNGEVKTNDDGTSDYQLIFEKTTCTQLNNAEIFLPMSSLYGVLSQ